MSNVIDLKNAVLKKKLLLYGSAFKLNEIIPTVVHEKLVTIATPFYEIAVFNAIAGTCKDGKHKYYADPGGCKNKIFFDMCPQTIDTLVNGNPLGYVYLLEPAGFKKISNISHCIDDVCYPVGCIEVRKDILSFYPTTGQSKYSLLLKKDIIELFN